MRTNRRVHSAEDSGRVRLGKDEGRHARHLHREAQGFAPRQLTTYVESKPTGGPRSLECGLHILLAMLLPLHRTADSSGNRNLEQLYHGEFGSL